MSTTARKCSPALWSAADVRPPHERSCFSLTLDPSVELVIQATSSESDSLRLQTLSMGLGNQCPLAAFAPTGDDLLHCPLPFLRLHADEAHDRVASTSPANPLRRAIERGASLMVGNFVGTSSPSPLGA